MVTKDSTATRHRILAAARSEFADYGIAGARVARIAQAAACNKQLIYAYFDDKEGLYRAVHAAAVAEVAEAVPFDADDLPGYATRLFDFHHAHPQILRLTQWAELEQPPGAVSAASVASVVEKLTAIKAAQAAGTVSTRRGADEILALVLRLSGLGAPGSPEAAYSDDTDRFRAAIHSAITELVG